MFNTVARVMQALCVLVVVACLGLWGYEWLNPSTESLKNAASKAILLAGQFLAISALIQVVLENRRLKDEIKALKGPRNV